MGVWAHNMFHVWFNDLNPGDDIAIVYGDTIVSQHSIQYGPANNSTWLVEDIHL